MGYKTSFSTNKIPKKNEIEIKVEYDLGGMNCFSGNKRPRGYYLHITPYESSGSMKVYSAFSNIMQCIKQVNRYNANEEKKLWQKVEPFAERIARAFEIDDKASIVTYIRQMGFVI